MIRIITVVILLKMISATGLAQVADFSSINFSKADNNAFRYADHSLQNPKLLSDKLTHGLSSDVEKFRAIYRWTCENIEYDYSLFQKNQRHREKQVSKTEAARWNHDFNTTVFKILREKRKTICTGYAYLLRELSKHAGIECVIVDGYGRTSQSNVGGNGIPNHSWNAVRLKGKWYLCDATWASGAVENRFHQFIKNYDDAYFLADPAIFIRNHYPLDGQWTLLNDTTTLNDFLNRPIIYSNAYRYQIKNPSPAKFNVSVDKGNDVAFRFESSCDLKDVTLMIDGIPTNPTLEKKHSLYSMNRAFKNKGIHVVHLMVDNKSVLTYRVNVK